MAEPSHAELLKLKVADLKKLLKDKNLPITGNKADLIQRLQEAGHAVPGEDAENVDDDLNDISDDVLNDDHDEISDKNKENVAETATTPDVASESQQTKLTAKPAITTEPITAPAATETTTAPDEDAKTATTQAKTPEERLAERAKRFGASSEQSKKQSRAERFGITEKSSGKGTTGSTTVTSGADVDKLKKRAERFGAVTAPTLSKGDMQEKLQKRADRFGVVSPTVAKTAETDKLQKRKQRFSSGDAGGDIEEKRNKRAERFGLEK